MAVEKSVTMTFVCFSLVQLQRLALTFEGIEAYDCQNWNLRFCTFLLTCREQSDFPAKACCLDKLASDK